MSKPALGRGLGALLGGTAPVVPPEAPAAAPATPPAEVASPEPRERVQTVAVDQIAPNPFQPRKDFSEEALAEMVESIKAQGVLQPLVVRRKENRWELIAGERRWRAAQRAGLATVPVVVREVSDAEALELALIENLQRENLNPIEEALGYKQLIEQFQLRQEDAARKVGKNRATVANALRLLKLPPPVQERLRSGELSVGHAKVLLGLTDPAQQEQAAAHVLAEGLNVRQTEELVDRLLEGEAVPTAGSAETAPRKKRTSAPPDVHVASLQARLEERLGTKVAVRYRKGRGAVQIRFFSDAELERLLELLGVRAE